jgi:hypothetical protein
MAALINWAVLIVSVATMVFVLKKPPIKDWIIVFFLKGFISLIGNNIFVSYGLLSYPDRLFPRIFQTTIVFDLFAFPVLCVVYNITSYKSSKAGIIVQAILYSIAATLFEVFLEVYTQVIEFHSWKWYHSFLFFISSFLVVRGVMALIRKHSQETA